MRKLIILILYKFIEFIEKIEFRNIEIDEEDNSKKIINSIPTDTEVISDSGWTHASYIHQTQPYRIWEIELENGYKLNCADNHIVFGEGFEELFVKDIKKGTKLITIDGLSKIIKISKSKFKVSMCDLTIDSDNHRYFTNGILSHNTVSAAITLLHFVLFNNDKGCMVIANKGETVIEIIDKIKSIYVLLPFFLQKGIKVWNMKSITFDNGSKIKSQARSKTPAIGFAIDFLYMDEFAHIPSNIIVPYYTAAYPTVSAIENSKIVITSTPNGMNLFHTILTNAEREDGDPLKSNYKSMRVYWNQVPGRNVTYLRLNRQKMEEYKVDRSLLYKKCCEKWMPNGEIDHNNLPIVKEWWDEENGRWVINVQNFSCEEEDVKKLILVNNEGKEVPVFAFCSISTWKDDTIKDLGGGEIGSEAFNQEYGLKFIAGAKSLFEEKVIERLLNKKIKFEFTEIDILDDKLNWDYSNLKWITEDIFHHSNKKDIKGIISVDVSEGLGQDYSVINIFQIVPKSSKEIESGKHLFKTFVDFFKLRQIGIFRSNIVSVGQLAELVYILAFEYFNEDNFKIVLEINNHGLALLEAIPNVFEQNNNYGSHIFMRYKHRIDALTKSIGLKVGRNKNLFVKEYQTRITNGDIEIFDETTIKEITTFIKHTTPAGNIVYKADIGSDDCAMTLVNMSTAFKEISYKDLVDEVLSLSPDFNKKVNEILDDVELLGKESAPDYGSFLTIKNRYNNPNF